MCIRLVASFSDTLFCLPLNITCPIIDLSALIYHYRSTSKSINLNIAVNFNSMFVLRLFKPWNVIDTFDFLTILYDQLPKLINFHHLFDWFQHIFIRPVNEFLAQSTRIMLRCVEPKLETMELYDENTLIAWNYEIA